MAKQSGIHQIKGKVGEMSYYKTKGVSAGIIRSINQGMSERVKTGDEYANTRLNNAEFKNANSIATAAFNSVNTRKRGMMRTFAVANMTKRALEDIKAGSGTWGVRLPVTELDTLICDMLENYAKGGKYDGFYGEFENLAIDNQGALTGSFHVDIVRQQQMKELGIDGLMVVYSKCLAGEILVDGEPRLFAGNSVVPATPVSFESTPVDINIQITGSVATPASVGMSPSGYEFAQEDTKHGFYFVATIIPLRAISNRLYSLQELCTYVAIPLGQIPE